MIEVQAVESVDKRETNFRYFNFSERMENQSSKIDQFLASVTTFLPVNISNISIVSGNSGEYKMYTLKYGLKITIALR